MKPYRALVALVQAVCAPIAWALDAIDRRWPCAFPNLTGDDDD